jgi:hypothetical protein
MKLEVHTHREVAEALACSKRSVERRLNLIRKRWEAGGEGTEDERPWEATP